MDYRGTLRPGVFSQYTATTLYARGRSAKAAALLCRAGSSPGELQRCESFAEAGEIYSAQEDSILLEAMRLLFLGGVSVVYAVAVADESGYGAAFDLCSELADLGILLCDSEQSAALIAMGDAVASASSRRLERLGVAAVADPERATELAAAINNERVILCCGSGCSAVSAEHPLYLAAALAAQILSAGTADVNLNSAAMPGLGRISPQLTDSQVEKLLRAGVTVFEQAGEGVECIRAVTTRTTTGGIEDATYRDISTVLIIDDVMSSVRNMLKIRMAKLRNNAQTRESIVSQITVELSGKCAEGLLESFEVPIVYPSKEDSSICIVELAFRVAHIVNQIHIQAQITV